MHEASPDLKGLDCGAPHPAQGFGHLGSNIVGEVKMLVHDIHDRRRPAGHGLKEGFAFGTDHGIVGSDIARDEFFHDIGMPREIRIEFLQVRIIFQLIGGQSADTDLRLDDDRIVCLGNKGSGSIQAFGESGGFGCIVIRDLELAGCGNAGFFILFFHQSLALKALDPVGFDTCCDIKIGAQPGIQFQPVLVVGFDPVYFSVFKRKESDCTEDILVVFQ